MIAPIRGEDYQVSLRPDRDETTDTTGALDWLDPTDVTADVAYLFDAVGVDTYPGLRYTVEADGPTLIVTVTDPEGATRTFTFRAVTW